MTVAFTILGEPASKANQRQLVKFGKRPALIKSEKARDYESAAVLQIPNEAKLMLECPVVVTMRIYYSSERPDLDPSVILDVLQARYTKSPQGRTLVRRGVYVNDRQVREMHLYHLIDRKNPRAEIVVSPLV
jgi:Holliday junction resolvase RusA-like endonuclease